MRPQLAELQDRVQRLAFAIHEGEQQQEVRDAWNQVTDYYTGEQFAKFREALGKISGSPIPGKPSSSQARAYEFVGAFEANYNHLVNCEQEEGVRSEAFRDRIYEFHDNLFTLDLMSEFLDRLHLEP